MPYGTGRSGDNVRINYGSWDGISQHVTVATPKDAIGAVATRTALVNPDTPAVGPFNPSSLTKISLLDGNYVVVGGTSSVANTQLTFLLVCYTDADSLFMSQPLGLSVGGYYKVGTRFLLTGGAAVAGPFVGVESVAICVTDISGGSWNLEAKVCF